jgi:hypothetical protein
LVAEHVHMYVLPVHVSIYRTKQEARTENAIAAGTPVVSDFSPCILQDIIHAMSRARGGDNESCINSPICQKETIRWDAWAVAGVQADVPLT